MNLRDYLEQRERELLELLADLHRQVAPLEAELAEIRRAKSAIGIVKIGETMVFSSGTLVGGGDVSGGGLIDVSDPANRGWFRDQPGTPLALKMASSPYAQLTMKQLVVKVLREHFKEGATTRQMLEFFRDAWGRDIERTNLSPQLSRLFRDRIIGRRDDHAWFLLGEIHREEPPSPGGVVLAGGGGLRMG